METNLTKIFKDTKSLYQKNDLLKASCDYTRTNAKFYIADKAISCNREVYQEPAKVVVSAKRSFEAAEQYKGQKTAVLNFANSFNPGGGVVHGARAQEECLCRCSTLYDSLNSEQMLENFYNKHRLEWHELATDDIIYSPAVKVFKSDTENPELLPQDKWFDVDVITCAAPNLYVGWNNMLKISESELSAIHKKRLRKILDVAVANGAEVVILGAFGCGAFGNPPEVVAEAIKKVIFEYKKSFKVIEFAVYCSKSDTKNYDVFNQVLGNLVFTH